MTALKQNGAHFYEYDVKGEFLGDDRAIFRAGVFRSLAFHCKILNMP
jgi:hypothetical protein